jgi:hypothetical protein
MTQPKIPFTDSSNPFTWLCGWLSQVVAQNKNASIKFSLVSFNNITISTICQEINAE